MTPTQFLFSMKLLALLLLATPLAAIEIFEEVPINYSGTEAESAMTRIADRIAMGEALLQAPTDREILAEVLTELEVDAASQVLVFSKTSAQNARISPWTPRAIYFSENAYVGWVQNGNIETITFDKKLGAVFHIIDLNRRGEGESPEIRRETSCLSCHASTLTNDVPGILVRSVYPDNTGRPMLEWGSTNTTHGSAISTRWGGWYVTGRPGSEGHLGNVTFGKGGSKLVAKGVVESLSLDLNTKPYLGGGQSDIVALMLLEHQVTVHNAILAGHLSAIRFQHQNRAIRKSQGEDPDAPLSDSYQRALDNLCEKMVRALLFAEEYELPDDGPEGGEAFQKAFAKGARPAENGHSLREMRLYERLFKYRCSYLIYCDAFTHLHPLMKTRVLERMHEILTHPGADPDYEHLSASECKKILAILSDTLPAWDETNP